MGGQSFEGPDTNEAAIPYALTAKDFTVAPSWLEKYVPGKKITRQNFTLFLIQSFALSRGTLPAQFAFFRWNEAHTGLDMDATLDAFAAAGGFDALSEGEQDLFKEAFERVVRHGQGLEDENTQSTDYDKVVRTRLRNGIQSVVSGEADTIRALHMPRIQRERDLAFYSQLDFAGLKQRMNFFIEEARKNKEKKLDLS